MSSVSTSGVPPAALSNEAASLLEKAKQYRAEMDALPESDLRREVYEKIIRDLLRTSNTLSTAVITSVTI
jgi:hypothetical protein